MTGGTAATLSVQEKRERVRRLLAGESAPSLFAERVNPRVAQVLAGLGLDVEYVHGSGTVLTDRAGRQYLDFAGAYGALPFGHNPSEIWQAIGEYSGSGEPSLVQPSLLTAAGELADRLCRLAPDGLDRAWFCNSGAEAVEAAIKVVRGARADRTWVMSTQNGFHGKTLGALSVTGRATYQMPFGAPAPGFAHVPYGDLAAARTFFAQHPGDVAAVVVEPIQGEGGIHPAPQGYLAGLRELCDHHDSLLVVDEVQTGLGRTGTMFAVEQDAVRPDVITLAKALGGGLVPIGAVLFGRRVESEAFDLRHTSTFGANAFCSRVGMASLDLLTREGGSLLAHVRARGDQLGAGLARIAGRHAPVVTAARGRGLLWGLELTSEPADFPVQGLFRSLASAEGLAAFVCGHLLREHAVRVAPTFFSGRVVRLEPPLTVSCEEVEKALSALDATLDLVSRAESRSFFSYLTDQDVQRCDVRLETPSSSPAVTTGARSHPVTAPAAAPSPHAVRWAFLAHPTDDLSYASYDRGLGLPGPEVRRLFDRLNMCRNVETPAGMLLGSAQVLTDDGTTTYGEVLALGHDARALIDMPRREAVALVRRAAREAVERGAQVVGLGAYTSIVTANGAVLDDLGAAITTGNAYTVSSAVDALTRLGADNVDVTRSTCAVIGAAGNIGRAATLLLAERVGRLVLGGNPRHPDRARARLQQVVEELVDHLSNRPPDVTGGGLARRVRELVAEGVDSPTIVRTLVSERSVNVQNDIRQALAGSPLVLLATSTPQSVVDPSMPQPGAVLCDVSQPPNLGPDLAEVRPDLTVVPGGLVRLPGGRDLGVDFGLPHGVTYACTAETLVAAARIEDPILSGGDRLSLDAVRAVGQQAWDLGFRLHVAGLWTS